MRYISLFLLGILIMCSFASALDVVYENFDSPTLNTSILNFFRSTGCDGGTAWNQTSGVASSTCTHTSANWAHGIQLYDTYDWNEKNFSLLIDYNIGTIAGRFLRIGYAKYLYDSSIDSSKIVWSDYYETTTENSANLYKINWTINQTQIYIYNTTRFIKNISKVYGYYPTIVLTGGGGETTNLTLENLNVSSYPNLSAIDMFNRSTYQTKSENFFSNVSLLPVPTSATLFNGNVSTTATISSYSNGYILSTSPVDTPLDTGLNLWYWTLTHSNGTMQNLTIHTRAVLNATLVNCTNISTSNGVFYYNLTFKNETTLGQIVKGSIISTIQYFLGSGSVNKTVSFSSSVESLNYTFCFNPSILPVNIIPTILYSNSESPQRTYTSSILTLNNVTTNRILYLLPSTVGIYTRYKVVTSDGAPVSEAFGIVSKTINGVSSTIASSTSDDSGQVVFFLNPDSTYDYVFSKSGVGSTSFSLNPNSLETYTVTLGGGVTGISNGSRIATNLTYSFTPDNDTLINNTVYTFSFTAAGNANINYMSMNLTNASGYQLVFITGTNQGTLSNALNTLNETKIIGYFVISTSTENISFSHVWIVRYYFIGDYSIYRQLKIFNQYGFKDFTRLIIMLAVIFSLMIYVNSNDLLDTSESKIGALLCIIWIFSLVGWLDTGIVSTTNNIGLQKLSQFSSQYGIAIVCSVLGLSFITRRIWQ